MNDWRSQLKYDPLTALLAGKDAAFDFFVRRDLLDEDPGPVDQLWELPGALKILRKQSRAGSWPRAGAPDRPPVNDSLIETWRQLRLLVEQYGFTTRHPQLQQAVEFVFSCQSPAGDFRGFIGSQYATYYTGALLALLVKAGCVDDPRVDLAYQWLLAMRQTDGGWTIPILTHYFDWQTVIRLTSQAAEPVAPDRAQPFSHNCTGMVLRAFAAHPVYCSSPEAWQAAGLLKSRFFQKDVYTSYQSAMYWVRFDYPFWWNNLVAALDSLAKIGIPADDPDIRLGLDWLLEHQETAGLWKLDYGKVSRPEKSLPRMQNKQLWTGLAICRIMRHYFP